MFLFNKLNSYPFWGILKKHRALYIWGLVALTGVDIINVILPLVIKWGLDGVVAKELRSIYWGGCLYFGLMVLQSWGRYLWRIYLIGASHRIARQLRLNLYSHLQRLPLGYYQRVRTGDLMSRATNDIEAVRTAIGPGVLVSVDALLMFTLIVPVMFYLSVKLSLLTFAFYPLVPFLTAWLGKRIDMVFEGLQVRMSKMSAFAQESFASIRLIKSLVLESRVERRFFDLSCDYKDEGLKLARYSAMFSPSLGLFTNLGSFLILLVGGNEVIEGRLSLGTFVAFQRFVVQLSWPMEAIGLAVTMNREGVAANRRLQQVLDVAEPLPTLIPEKAAPTMAGLPAVRIARIDFRYPVEKAEAQGFHLTLDTLNISPGSKVGLVGPVGSGKSTLFNCLIRLNETRPGSIILEGRDIAAIPLSELRRQVAGVEQQIFLFSESIEENLILGNSLNVSDDEMLQAVAAAEMSREVGELDQGMKTILGERGVNLSGGQKQRLALARALLRQPSLLLLDDCFSAVDVAVENRIIENVFTQFQNLTVIFASHRLSAMPLMDEVWILAEGKVVCRGTHDFLMRDEPLYRDLWEQSERSLQREGPGGAVQMEEGV